MKNYTKAELLKDLEELKKKEEKKVILGYITEKLNEKYGDDEMFSLHKEIFENRNIYFATEVYGEDLEEEVTVYVTIYFQIIKEENEEITNHQIEEDNYWVKVTNYSYYK